MLVEYSCKSFPNIIRTMELNPGVNTFRKIEFKFNRIIYLGAGSIGTVAGISHKKGKVSLFIKPSAQLETLKVSDFITKELRAV